MIKCKAILFDAFNTLIDLSPSYAGAFSELCADFGYPIGYRQIETVLPEVNRQIESRSCGPNGDYACSPELLHQRYLDYNRMIFEAVGVEGDPHAMAHEMEIRFNSGKYSMPFPDAHETLDRLREQGYVLGIISNGTPGVADCLRHLDIYDKVDTVLISALVGWEKPSPRIFKQALEQLNLAANDAIFVGDHYAIDIQGAVKAGMQAIHVMRDNPGKTRHEYTISSLNEIWPLLHRD